MQTLEKNARNTWGKRGEEWLQALPSILGALSRHWSLSDIKPVHNMTYHYVALARQHGEVPVVLKFGCDPQSVQSEYSALQHFDGRGSIRVLDYCSEHHALLLQQAIPGTLLKEGHLLNFSDTVFAYAQVVLALSKHDVSQEQSYPHMSDWLKALDRISDPRIDQRHVDRALQLRTCLFDTVERTYLCHGDLHLENIIQHEEKWLAIDPKGIVGEMAFEAAAFDLISEAEMRNIEAVAEKIMTRVTALASELDLDRNRLLHWIYLRVIMSAQWFIEDNGDPTRMIALADCLYPLLGEPFKKFVRTF